MKTINAIGAVGITTAPFLALAQTGAPVQLYGRLNLAVEDIHASTDSLGNSVGDVARVSNNRSVIGFRGTEDLGAGLRTVWQIESAVSLDTGTGAFAGRDTRIGLEMPFGTIFGGNWTTPYTSSTQTLDPFYPTTVGYMSIMGNGSAPSSDNVMDTSAFDRRQRNSVHYWTPKWGGFSARIAHGLSEEKTVVSKPSLTSLSGIYESGPVYLTLAHEQHKDYQGPGLTDKGAKIGAAYNFGTTRIGVVAENIRYETSTGRLERNAYYVSATHQMGVHGFQFGVAYAQDGKGPSTDTVGRLRSGNATGAIHYTLGYNYAFSKRTSLFAYLTRLDNDRNAVYDFAINEVGAGPGTKLTGAALGMRHSF